MPKLQFVITPAQLREVEEFLLSEVPDLAHCGPPTRELIVRLLNVLGMDASIAKEDDDDRFEEVAALFMRDACLFVPKRS